MAQGLFGVDLHSCVLCSGSNFEVAYLLGDFGKSGLVLNVFDQGFPTVDIDVFEDWLELFRDFGKWSNTVSWGGSGDVCSICQSL